MKLFAKMEQKFTTTKNETQLFLEGGIKQMKLSEIRVEFLKLKNEAMKVIGKSYSLPVSILDGNESGYDVTCTIDGLDISESYLEIFYKDKYGEEVITDISFDQFSKYTGI